MPQKKTYNIETKLEIIEGFLRVFKKTANPREIFAGFLKNPQKQGKNILFKNITNRHSKVRRNKTLVKGQ